MITISQAGCDGIHSTLVLRLHFVFSKLNNKFQDETFGDVLGGLVPPVAFRQRIR